MPEPLLARKTEHVQPVARYIYPKDGYLRYHVTLSSLCFASPQNGRPSTVRDGEERQDQPARKRGQATRCSALYPTPSPILAGSGDGVSIAGPRHIRCLVPAQGGIRGTSLAAARFAHLAFPHDQTTPFPVLQDKTGDDPLGGDDLVQVPARSRHSETDIGFRADNYLEGLIWAESCLTVVPLNGQDCRGFRTLSWPRPEQYCHWDRRAGRLRQHRRQSGSTP